MTGAVSKVNSFEFDRASSSGYGSVMTRYQELLDGSGGSGALLLSELDSVGRDARRTLVSGSGRVAMHEVNRYGDGGLLSERTWSLSSTTAYARFRYDGTAAALKEQKDDLVAWKFRSGSS